MAEITLERDEKTGMIWPPNDRNAKAWIVGDSVDIPEMVQVVRKFKPRVEGRISRMVEAGGHIGWWTKLFMPHFDVIYTFEPDPLNFACLTFNVPSPNIIKFNAALGYDRKMVMTGQAEHENSGSKYCVPEALATIPTIRLDDLALPDCDFIQFDLEGWETPALFGSVETMKRCSPVISVELRGHGEKFGFYDDEAIALLNDHGYTLETTIRSDSLFVKKEKPNESPTLAGRKRRRR